MIDFSAIDLNTVSVILVIVFVVSTLLLNYYLMSIASKSPQLEKASFWATVQLIIIIALFATYQLIT